MAVNRLSVLSVRFADISSESNDPSAERKLSGCTLADLPTIKFQAVSGLEISLPVIVDSLLTTYIEKLCPRRIMSAVKRGDKVEGHEMNMLRTALCTVYTVLTRCRGPLIWLEDDLKTDLTKSHPLVTMLREALAGGKMDIDFVTDRSEIDKVFVDRLFNSTDAVEVNAAFEESTCQILQKFKTSFFASVDKLTSLLEKEKKTFKGVRGGNVPSNLQKSDEYLALIEDRDLLLSQLTVSTHRGAEECRIFIRSLPDTLLLHAGSGDGSWTLKWGPHHK